MPLLLEGKGITFGGKMHEAFYVVSLQHLNIATRGVSTQQADDEVTR